MRITAAFLRAMPHGLKTFDYLGIGVGSGSIASARRAAEFVIKVGLVEHGRLSDAGAGGSDDYAKKSAGVKCSYTPELRDTGKKGFVLPENEILPACQETWAGVKSFAIALATV